MSIVSDNRVIFEKSIPGHRGVPLPPIGVPEKPLSELLPAAYLRQQPAPLPEVTELDVMRHFIQLSHKNHAIDVGFYPLGSCTMKYNPKVNEKAARLEGFAQAHPYQSTAQVQGCLQLLYELGQDLANIVGLPAVTLQPAAGAHGELTGIMMIQAHHQHTGQTQRNLVIVPDSAHGTNPSSAAMCGYQIANVRSNTKGQVDMQHLQELLDSHPDTIAAMMMTNPNTAGLFEENVVAIAQRLHEAGALMYYDGANLNAIMGWARPGDMGFDVCHLNLHKTFSTPHGGGGPGAGPVLVNETLRPYLPSPVITYHPECQPAYDLDHARPHSIGRVRSFYGNFGVLVRAYAYIRAMGADGLKQASQDAVLNANYIKEQLKADYDIHYPGICMHEFVISAQNFKKEHGVNALAIAKRLIDFGIHPPTIYFPLIVPEALMIEPTETENLPTLKHFTEVMAQIAQEARENPERLLHAPYKAPIHRVDEALANRKPVVNWFAGAPTV